MRPRIVAPLIRSDEAGDGHFGAHRGDRTHKGIDYLCDPRCFVYSPVEGIVSKLGYPYSDDLSWRYVEITDDRRNRNRLFYVLPCVRLDQIVSEGEIIGEAQDISERYPGQGMTAHVHLEIIGPDGEYINPED